MTDESTEQALILSPQDAEYSEALRAKSDQYARRGKHAEEHGIRVALAYFLMNRKGLPLPIAQLPPTGFGDLDITL
jgi:hypothetical protein